MTRIHRTPVALQGQSSSGKLVHVSSTFAGVSQPVRCQIYWHAAGSVYVAVDSKLTFEAIGYGVVGLLLLIAFILSLMSIQKASHSGALLRGFVGLTLTVIALWAFISLFMAYVRERSGKEISPHVQTEIVKADSLPR